MKIFQNSGNFFKRKVVRIWGKQKSLYIQPILYFLSINNFWQNPDF